MRELLWKISLWVPEYAFTCIWIVIMLIMLQFCIPNKKTTWENQILKINPFKIYIYMLKNMGLINSKKVSQNVYEVWTKFENILEVIMNLATNYYNEKWFNRRLSRSTLIYLFIIVIPFTSNTEIGFKIKYVAFFIGIWQ